MADAVEKAGVVNLVQLPPCRPSLWRSSSSRRASGWVFHWRAQYLQTDRGPSFLWSGGCRSPRRSGSGRYRAISSTSPYLCGGSRSDGAHGDLHHERPLLAEVTGGLSAEAGSGMGTVDVDDAALWLAKFDNGAIGTFEATRFAPGGLNKNRWEINGEHGSIRFNLERLTELEVFSRKDPEHIQGWKTIQVSQSVQPYVAAYWPPGHHIGWEHTLSTAFTT